MEWSCFGSTFITVISLKTNASPDLKRIDVDAKTSLFRAHFALAHAWSLCRWKLMNIFWFPKQITPLPDKAKSWAIIQLLQTNKKRFVGYKSVHISRAHKKMYISNAIPKNSSKVFLSGCKPNHFVLYPITICPSTLISFLQMLKINFCANSYCPGILQCFTKKRPCNQQTI